MIPTGDDITEYPFESVTTTVTEYVPIALGVQTSVEFPDDAHPGGRSNPSIREAESSTRRRRHAQHGMTSQPERCGGRFRN